MSDDKKQLIRDHSKAYYHKNKQVLSLKGKHARRDPANRPRFILEDTRKSDKRRNQLNDLTVEWIAEQFADGQCSYCGETELLLTLDRIDNTHGHSMANVCVACERCNMFRRDMPFGAWLVVAEGMRKVRELNLFEGWTGSIHRRRVLPELPAEEPKAPHVWEHGTLAGYKWCRRANSGSACSACNRAMADWKQGRRNLARKSTSVDD